MNPLARLMERMRRPAPAGKADAGASELRAGSRPADRVSIHT